MVKVNGGNGNGLAIAKVEKRLRRAVVTVEAGEPSEMSPEMRIVRFFGRLTTCEKAAAAVAILLFGHNVKVFEDRIYSELVGSLNCTDDDDDDRDIIYLRGLLDGLELDTR